MDWKNIWLSEQETSVDNNIFYRLYRKLILNNIARLYIFGPRFAGFGFWQGRSPEQICESITESSSSFWKLNMDECNRLINQHFNSYVVLIEFILYMYIVYKAFIYLEILFEKILQKLYNK
jgi:hypothetical protein